MQDEIRLRCLGTATPASKLVPIAVGIAGRLREVDQYGTQNVRGENWRIDVKLSGGFAQITIWEDGDVLDVEACPSYISGMLRYGMNLYRYLPATGAKVSGAYSFNPETSYAARVRLGAGWTIAPIRLADATVLSGAPMVPPSYYYDQPSPWKAESWSQAAYLKPGFYSGRMRQVVQVLLGSGIPVQYEYQINCTHGVFRSTRVIGRKTEQADWLVEISRARGVLAMELPACRGSVPPENTLGYVPTGATFPTGPALEEAIKKGRVRRLLLPSALDEVYSKSSFSNMFGWAFSYDGTKASVVVYSSDEHHKTTYLYTISLAGTNGPASASLEMEDSGSIICAGYSLDGYARCSFKVASIPFGTCFPVDLQSSPPYIPTNCDAPLHVFYKQGGERATVRFRASVQYDETPPDENPRPPGNWFASDANLNKEFVEYIGTGNWMFNQQIYIGDPPEFDKVAATRKTFRASASQGTVQWFSLESGNMTTGTKYLRLSKLMRMFEKTDSGVGTQVYTSVVIPSTDREAAAYHSAATDYINARSESFATFDCNIASATYSVDGEALKPENTRPDGLPTKGVATYVPQPGSGKESNGMAYVPASGLTGTSDIYRNWIHSGSFDYFGSFYGSGESLPDSFTFPYGIPETPPPLMAPIKPYSGAASFSHIIDRRATKRMVTSSGSYSLRKNAGVDEFATQTVAASLDRAWFGPDPCACVHVATWDGGKRFMPPDLNSYEIASGYSSFGDYGDPPVGLEMTINFVGDA